MAQDARGERNGPSLRTKLRAVVLVLMLSGGAAGAVIFTSFSTVESQLTEVADRALPTVMRALNLSETAVSTAAALPRLSAATTQSGRDAAFHEAVTQARRLRDLLTELADMSDRPGVMGPMQNAARELVANVEAQNDLVRNRLDLAESGRQLRLTAETPRAVLRNNLTPLLSSPDLPDRAADQADELLRLVNSEAALFNQIANAANADWLRPIEAQLAQISGRLEEMLDELPQVASYEPIRRAVRTVLTNRQRAGALLAQQKLQFEVDTDIQAVVTESRALLDALSKGVGGLVDKADAAAEAATESTRRELISARAWLGLIALLGLVLPAGFVWFVFGPNITARLTRLADSTRRIAAGDLEAQIPHTPRRTLLLRDEIGEMTDSLAIFRDAMVRLKARETSLERSEALLSDSEQRLRAILSSASAGIGLVDLSGHFVEINPAFRRITGYDEQQLAGMTEDDLTADDDRLQSHQKIMDLLRGTVSSFHYEKRYRHAGGSLVWVDISGSVLRGPQGEVEGLIFLAQDINERKAAEQALKDREQELEELNHQKNRFFSIIAHDLRSPFNSILGFSEILADADRKLPPEKTREYAQVIRETARNVFELLEQLLEWARLQMNRVTFEPGPLDLREASRLAASATQAQAEQKGVAVSVDMPSLLAHADAGMIETVLRNLLGNAVKFTPSGGRISIVAGETDAATDAGMVALAVRDTGVGMTEEQIDGLFRLDRHQSTPGTDNEPGTGLGLLLCRELIDKHDGRIRVESEPGTGTTFTIVLPAAGSGQEPEPA